MTTCTLTPSKTKPVSSLINSILSRTGSRQKYSKIVFSKSKYPYLIDESLDIVNSGIEIEAEPEAVIKLENNSDLKSMVPIFHAEGIRDITLRNLFFDGNRNNQTVPHGKGYHNFFGGEDVQNLEVYGCTLTNSKGDGVRVQKGENIHYYNNMNFNLGHDGLYTEYCTGVTARGNVTALGINSALRCRSCDEVEFSENLIYKVPGILACSPGIQVEISGDKLSSENVSISKNHIHNTDGPGVWAIVVGTSDNNASKNWNISENVFMSCGNMEKAIQCSGVGGVVFDGCDISITENVFCSCFGYGVMAGKYQGNSSGKGYEAVIENNVFTYTKAANYPGTASGYAIADLSSGKYTITSKENIFFGNVGNFYGVKAK